MAIETLNIKRHDLQPYYKFKITDSSGTAISCEGASVCFTMVGDTGIVVNRAPCVLTNATLGEGEYRWAGTDTAVAGTYEIEIEIEPAQDIYGNYPGKFTVPVSEKAKVKIWPDLGEAPVI